ncbi:hypothetical protein D3C81_1394200 [compost metagenome]
MISLLVYLSEDVIAPRCYPIPAEVRDPGARPDLQDHPGLPESVPGSVFGLPPILYKTEKRANFPH